MEGFGINIEKGIYVCVMILNLLVSLVLISNNALLELGLQTDRRTIADDAKALEALHPSLGG